jgi:hypothetical protein
VVRKSRIQLVDREIEAKEALNKSALHRHIQDRLIKA